MTHTDQQTSVGTAAELEKRLAAAFINPEAEEICREQWTGSYLRKKFRLSKKADCARLYITACGIYQAYMNGKEISVSRFAPGFTNYTYRLQYQEYDVTGLLERGDNVLSMILGNGWYRGCNGGTGTMSMGSEGPVWGKELKISAVLHLRYEDGTEAFLDTAKDVRATQDGALRFNDMRGGETYDATKEWEKWLTPDYDDSGWHGVRAAAYEGRLIPHEGVPICAHEHLKGRYFRTPAGEDVIDFGQNLSGAVRIRVKGTAGQRLVMICGETLDENGNFTLKNLSGEESPFGQVITYILKDGIQEYEPQFCYMGFRYVKLAEYPGEIHEEDFTAVAVYSDVPMNGEFSCSNEKINRLFENVRWSLKGNFMDIPTDCPTREHAGWTGDAMVFCETSNWIADCGPFWKKWMRDVALQQRKDGCVPCIVPDSNPAFGARIDGSAGWGDAVEVVPYLAYEFYNDKSFVEEFYPNVCRWVEFNEERAKKDNEKNKDKKGEYRKYILDTGYHWGEWKEPGAPQKSTVEGFMERAFSPDAEVATGFFAHAADLASRMARILGREKESRHYRQLFEHIREAYQKEFLPDGLPVESSRQCKYVRPIAFDLVDQEQKRILAEKLAELVKEKDCHIGTGFLTTGWILPALADNGQTEAAYALLENEECPGWLYCVRKGATTTWESWDGIDENGVPKDSLNHYSAGSVAAWFFRGICGIRLSGGKEIVIAPKAGGTLSWAKASWRSESGIIRSGWQIEGEEICYEIEIPEGMNATFSAGHYKEKVGAGKHTFRIPVREEGK